MLVNVYRRADTRRLYHLDAFRLSGPQEAADLDLEALLASGPLVVEWAERIQAALPAERLRIHFNYVDEYQRDLVLTAHGDRYKQTIGKLRKMIYGVR